MGLKLICQPEYSQHIIRFGSCSKYLITKIVSHYFNSRSMESDVNANFLTN